VSFKTSGATNNDAVGHIWPAGLVFDTCAVTSISLIKRVLLLTLKEKLIHNSGVLVSEFLLLFDKKISVIIFLISKPHERRSSRY